MRGSWEHRSKSPNRFLRSIVLQSELYYMEPIMEDRTTNCMPRHLHYDNTMSCATEYDTSSRHSEHLHTCLLPNQIVLGCQKRCRCIQRNSQRVPNRCTLILWSNRRLVSCASDSDLPEAYRRMATSRPCSNPLQTDPTGLGLSRNTSNDYLASSN